MDNNGPQYGFVPGPRPAWEPYLKKILGALGPDVDAGLGRMIENPLGVLTDSRNSGWGMGPKAAMTLGAAAGMMVGPRAVGANLPALTRAKELQERGMSGKDVHKLTGWWQDLDRKWKYEISDQHMSVGTLKNVSPETPENPHYMIPMLEDSRAVPGPGDVKNRTLRDTINHPEAYAAYPGLGKIPVRAVGTTGAQGAYSPAEDKMWFSSGGTETILDRAAHEMQHAIQAREGWAEGGSSSQFLPKLFQKSLWTHRNITNQVEKQLQKDTPGLETWGLEAELPKWAADIPGYFPRFRAEQADRLQKLQAHPDGAYFLELQNGLRGLEDMEAKAREQYKNLSGEALARLTETRRDYPVSMRRSIYPPSDYDVPLAQQTKYAQDELPLPIKERP